MSRLCDLPYLKRAVALLVLIGAVVLLPPQPVDAWPECGVERLFYSDASFTEVVGIRVRDPITSMCTCQYHLWGQVTGFWEEQPSFCPGE